MRLFFWGGRGAWTNGTTVNCSHFVSDLHAGDLLVKVLHAPCHTSGHVLYYVESRSDMNAKPIIFTGYHNNTSSTFLDSCVASCSALTLFFSSEDMQVLLAALCCGMPSHLRRCAGVLTNSNTLPSFRVLSIEIANATLCTAGDTLFLAGCGRFFEGDAQQMHRALIKTIGSLPAETLVYCGHEYTVTNLKYAEDEC